MKYSPLFLWFMAAPLLFGAPAVDFNREVRPILSDRCLLCHGPDVENNKADLRLDTVEGATDPRGDKGAAIVPGNPEASLLIQRIITHDAAEIMPPPKSNLSLSAKEIDLLKAWIKGGAPYDDHWAFTPLPPIVPLPKGANAASPIDAFIRTRLAQEKLSPSPPASRERWLRRVSYDLTGLPPTPEETAAFLADTQPDAFERAADRLLASPHFGERIAVPWLDSARYADSYGYQSDRLNPQWPYRDWVVRQFNNNLPYDTFLTWQIAGDQIPNPTRESRLATAFSRMHRMTNEGGSIAQEFLVEHAADRVQTFGTAVLGLTMECCRCHDHKYDPISMRNYYSMFAYFNSINERGLIYDSAVTPAPYLPLPTPDQEKVLAAKTEASRAAEATLATVSANRKPAFNTWIATLTPETTAPNYLPDHFGHFDFEDQNSDGKMQSRSPKTNGDRRVAHRNGLLQVDSPRGKGVALNGDTGITIPKFFVVDRSQPFSFALWVKDTKANPLSAVILHRSSGTDIGFHGQDLRLEGGHLVGRFMRDWPGNALAVKTSKPVVKRNLWTHIAWTYDGSSTAGGMTFYVNGASVPVDILADGPVFKEFRGGGTFTLGQRFRDRGFDGGHVDDLHVLYRTATPIEIRHLYDGNALTEALRNPAAHRSELEAYWSFAIDPEIRKARTALMQARIAVVGAENPIHSVSVMADKAKPTPAHILNRGAYDAPRTDANRVPRGIPEALGKLPAGAPDNRYGLAQWVTAPNNPLTARVAINRFWQMLFGRGLVETSENFGMQGSLPSHPELLDWLSRDFIDSGWDVKRLLRNLVLSETYRQDSVLRPDLAAKDPENILLGRGPVKRLDAEAIRDGVLAASGLLNTQAGGPPISPYQPGKDLWRENNGMSPSYRQSTGKALYRRSVYSVWKRTAPLPNMMAFDTTTREVCTVKRPQTNTPLQALVLLNDIQFVEAARVTASRVLTEAKDDTARVVRTFEYLANRSPDARETALLRELLTEQRAYFTNEPDRAKKLIGVGSHPAPKDADPIELAALTVTAQAVLNADLFIMQR